MAGGVEGYILVNASPSGPFFYNLGGLAMRWKVKNCDFEISIWSGR